MRSARIDLEAIRENVRRTGATVVDVSGDGYGHGAVEAARAAVDGGATAILLRDDDAGGGERMLRAAGITAIVRPASPTDPATVTDCYGVGPRAEADRLRPAMRVGAHVVGVKTIEAGEPVSYGYTWRASMRSTLALVPLGYADREIPSAGNRGFLHLDGVLRPIVGRVAMDVLVLDLGADDAALGAEAVLFGDPAQGETGAGRWADWAGMTALEATSAMGRRIPRSWT
jgi:alanine racemase